MMRAAPRIRTRVIARERVLALELLDRLHDRLLRDVGRIRLE